MKVKPGDKVLLRGCGSYRGSPRFIVAYQQEDDTVVSFDQDPNTTAYYYVMPSLYKVKSTSILKVLEKEDLGERSDIHR